MCSLCLPEIGSHSDVRGDRWDGLKIEDTTRPGEASSLPTLRRASDDGLASGERPCGAHIELRALRPDLGEDDGEPVSGWECMLQLHGQTNA